MNKQIEKLLEQAMVLVPASEGSFNYWHFDKEKFAELIVRECADIAKHHVMNISTYADADFVDEQIKEHFGVEQ